MKLIIHGSIIPTGFQCGDKKAYGSMVFLWWIRADLARKVATQRPMASSEEIPVSKITWSRSTWDNCHQLDASRMAKRWMSNAA